MSVSRVIYVAQDFVAAWRVDRTGVSEIARFAQTEIGHDEFAVYLDADREAVSRVLVDVIEEEFVIDTLPSLASRDRSSLMIRRLGRKFSRTPYRLCEYQGLREHNREPEVLYHAVTNPDLLRPWVDELIAKQVPVESIQSVPLLGSRLLEGVCKPAPLALLMTHHQGDRLRQVFLRQNQLKSARLSAVPGVSDPQYGSEILAEIQRSRRYLERSRLLGPAEELAVYVVADRETANRIVAADSGQTPANLNFVHPDSAASAFAAPREIARDRLEFLYHQVASKARSVPSYAQNGETHYYSLSRVRRVIIGTAVAASLLAAVGAGLNINSAFQYRQSSVRMVQQIAQMEDTFRRENQQFAPIRADSHEMKLAVDSGDFVLTNRVPVAWVMQQVGTVFGEFPEVRMDALRWRAEGVMPEENTANTRNRVAAPALLGELAAVSAEITGQVAPFNGSYKDAFATIRRLTESLEASTAFSEVITVEFPIDARPTSSVSGELVKLGGEQVAQFRVRLRLDLAEGESGERS